MDDPTPFEVPVPRYLDAAARPFADFKPARELTTVQLLAILPGLCVGLVCVLYVDFFIGALLGAALAAAGALLYTAEPRPPLRVYVGYWRRTRGRR